MLTLLALFLLTQSPGWGFLLLLVALGTLILGVQLLRMANAARDLVAAQLKSLDAKVERTTKEAITRQERDRADREFRKELVARFQTAQSSLRRW